MRRIATLVSILLVWVAMGSVQAEAPARDHDITIDDYFSLAIPMQSALSPNGRYAAYVDLRWEPETRKRNGDIWVVEVSSGKTRRLTFDSAFDGYPQWSPDSQRLYFKGSRTREGKKAPYNGKSQVWRIAVSGGGLAPVTRLSKGVTAFELSADGQALYYVVGKKHVDEEWSALRNAHALQYGHGVATYSQIWKLDLTTWRAEKLVDDNRVLVAFSVSPDERRIAMITRPTEALISNEGQSRVDIFDANAHTITALPDTLWRADAPSPYGWLDSPAWSHDNGALAFTVAFDGYPSELFVANFSTDAPTLRKMKRSNEETVSGGGPVHWRGRSHDLMYLAEDKARVRVYVIEGATSKKPKKSYAVTAGDVVVNHFDVNRAGSKVLTIMASPTHFGDLFWSPIRRGNQRHKQLTRVNPQTDRWKLPIIKDVTWKSPDGTSVHGVLELPPGHEPGQPLPMVVYLHGGPASSTKMRLQFWSYGRTFMAAQGYALFAPNYRGSTGFGDRFLVDLIGRKNDVDVADILSGVDAMVAQGIADPQRLGVMGWSNGGYLTNCVITKTTRFKAASSGAGVFDVVMQWGIEDTPGHVINYQKGFPWNRSKTMHKASPLYSADKIRTPTIIHVGENDPRCPPEHSRALYRTLREYIRVPTELLVYPNEGHGLRKGKHRYAKMAWDVAWFKRFVLGDDGNDDKKNGTAEPSEAKE